MNSFVLEWNEKNKAGNIPFHNGKITVKRPGYYSNFVYSQMYHYNDNRYRMIVLVILTTSKKN